MKTILLTIPILELTGTKLMTCADAYSKLWGLMQQLSTVELAWS
jgi:hypothetical protein